MNSAGCCLPGSVAAAPENMTLRIGDVLLGALWVLEWSQSQQAFHTETLAEALQRNIPGFYNQGKTGDYIVLGVFPTREEVDQYYELMVDRMRQWAFSTMTVEDLLRDPSP